MIDQLRVEVERIASETAANWIERGPTPRESWLLLAPFCERIGLRVQVQQDAVEANLPPDLHTLRGVQHGGQRRRMFCVRLDALPRVLLRIDANRVDDDHRPLIFALQEHLYEILTEKIYGTGTGDRPAAAFRAVIAEHTGYTLPMFANPPAEPDDGAPAARVDTPPIVRLGPSECLTPDDADAREIAERWREAGGWGSTIDEPEGGAEAHATAKLLHAYATLAESIADKVVQGVQLTLEQIAEDVHGLFRRQDVSLGKISDTQEMVTRLSEHVFTHGADLTARAGDVVADFVERGPVNLTTCTCGLGARPRLGPRRAPRPCPVHQPRLPGM